MKALFDHLADEGHDVHREFLRRLCFFLRGLHQKSSAAPRKTTRAFFSRRTPSERCHWHTSEMFQRGAQRATGLASSHGKPQAREVKEIQDQIDDLILKTLICVQP